MLVKFTVYRNKDDLCRGCPWLFGTIFALFIFYDCNALKDARVFQAKRRHGLSISSRRLSCDANEIGTLSSERKT